MPLGGNGCLAGDIEKYEYHIRIGQEGGGVKAESSAWFNAVFLVSVFIDECPVFFERLSCFVYCDLCLFLVQTIGKLSQIYGIIEGTRELLEVSHD